MLQIVKGRIFPLQKSQGNIIFGIKVSGCISSVSTVKRCGQLHRRQINISSGKQGVKAISIDMWSKSKQPEKELTGGRVIFTKE